MHADNSHSMYMKQMLEAGNKKEIIKWFQNKGIIKKLIFCCFCRYSMEIVEFKGAMDDHKWRCNNTSCKNRYKGISEETIFENMPLSFEGCFYTMTLWATNSDPQTCDNPMNLVPDSMERYYDLFDKMVVAYFTNSLYRLGGINRSLELLIFKGSVIGQPKPLIVVGLLEKAHDDTKLYLQICNDKPKEIYDILCAQVWEHTNIYCDFTQRYEKIMIESKYNFSCKSDCDKELKNHFRSYWVDVRTYLTTMKKYTSVEKVQAYLHRYAWIDRFKDDSVFQMVSQIATIHGY